MPRGDGTGPMGAGSMTGRGFGLCTDVKTVDNRAIGFGLGCRRGFKGGYGRSFVANQNSDKTQKDFLQEQKDFLQNRLEVIDKQLESM